MKLFKDKKIIALSIILVVFTIVYFVIVGKVSYAFSTDYNVNDAYNKVIDLIKKSAIVYGEKSQELFKDEKIAYIKVQDLIDKEMLATDEKGNINNPLNENSTLNSNIIKLKKEDDKIIAEVDS